MATAFPRPLLAPVTTQVLPSIRTPFANGGSWPSLLKRSYSAVATAVTMPLCPTALAPLFFLSFFIRNPITLTVKTVLFFNVFFTQAKICQVIAVMTKSMLYITLTGFLSGTRHLGIKRNLGKLINTLHFMYRIFQQIIIRHIDKALLPQAFAHING